ncbi:MAG: fatty acid desaturase [Candidatus Binatia bacterium]
MEENLSPSPRLTREDTRRLMARRDAPGLVLFAFQLIAFTALSLTTLQLAAAGNSLRFVTVTLDGLVLLTFFASMHEAGHGTAFATPWINRAVTWISAVLMLQSPTFFREFHFEHHRRTSDPNGDPEISGAPRLLGPWPANPVFYLLQASGQHLMVGKAMFTISSALLPGDAVFDRLYPFVRPALRRQVVRESRIVVLLLAGVCWFGLAHVAGFATLLLAWPIGHLALGLFVMPEHLGLGSEGSQLHRTRSTKSNALVRWAMWNMPYHSEHHAYPAVPFHAAPELSRCIEPEIENRASGYLAFHAEAVARSLRSCEPASSETSSSKKEREARRSD